MCYDIAYMTKRAEKYAEHYRIDVEQIRSNPASGNPVYHTQAFGHPDIPVLTDDDPGNLQFFYWGLIPFWVKDAAGAAKISNRTVNARGEEMFEKPAFRNSARHRRCLVVVDGFYEHHWREGKSYPFYIRLKNDEPFSLAGIWDRWENEKEGLTRYSVSIVTTAANRLLGKIHNNPKASIEPRMPVMLPRELEKQWLGSADDSAGLAAIRELVRPYDPDEMVAHPVNRLRGKSYIGNVPQIMDEYTYDDLPRDIWN